MTSDTDKKMKGSGANDNTLKYLSLITLTGQNALLGLSMRYARTRPGDMFISTTAVLMAETVKLLACLGLVWNAEGRSLERWWSALDNTIVKQPIDTLKITYQLKILTTAVFAVTMLNKKLIPLQWTSLLILVGGVAMVQLSDVKEQGASGSEEQSKFVGFSAALTACCLSGFAGVYFEKILKGSDVSVWMRNVQLALLSIPLGFCTTFLKDGGKISEHGFFHGYDSFVWFTVLQNALGGLLVAVVVKYADNILKGFACSLAIIITCVASIFIFDFSLSFQFVVGAAMVISSIFLYGYQPKQANSKLPQRI